MSRALIFSDMHLHSHKERIDRLEDCLQVLDWIFKTAVKNKCKYLFFLGDLFHERSKIDVMNYLKTFEVVMKHMIEDAVDLDFYLLVGNHDMYHRTRWDVNSIKPISAIPRCHVIAQPTTMVFDQSVVDWMPYTEDQIRDIDKLKKSKTEMDSNLSEFNLLLGHMAVHGAQTNLLFGIKSDVIVEFDNDMTPVDPSIFNPWKKTILGHYHGAQHLNDKVEYIGSPLQLSYGEAFQKKHVMILDLQTLKCDYIQNEFSPKHLIVTTQDITDENYKLDGNFVRIGYENMSQVEILDMRRKLAQSHKILSLDFKQKDKKTELDQTVIEESKAILIDQDKMLGSYIDTTGVPSVMNTKGVAVTLDKSRLLRTGEKVIERCSENRT